MPTISITTDPNKTPINDDQPSAAPRSNVSSSGGNGFLLGGDMKEWLIIMVVVVLGLVFLTHSFGVPGQKGPNGGGNLFGPTGNVLGMLADWAGFLFANLGIVVFLLLTQNETFCRIFPFGPFYNLNTMARQWKNGWAQIEAAQKSPRKIFKMASIFSGLQEKANQNEEEVEKYIESRPEKKQMFLDPLKEAMNQEVIADDGTYATTWDQFQASLEAKNKLLFGYLKETPPSKLYLFKTMFTNKQMATLVTKFANVGFAQLDQFAAMAKKSGSKTAADVVQRIGQEGVDALMDALKLPQINTSMAKGTPSEKLMTTFARIHGNKTGEELVTEEFKEILNENELKTFIGVLKSAEPNEKFQLIQKKMTDAATSASASARASAKEAAAKVEAAAAEDEERNANTANVLEKARADMGSTRF